MDSARAHWDAVYGSKPSSDLSWFEAKPTVSLRLVETWTPRRAGVVDVGAGTSTLVDHLLEDSFDGLTWLDVSGRALATVRERLGEAAHNVEFVVSDVLSWQPVRRFDTWHDRAVFHFLTDPMDRDRYVTLASDAVTDAGVIVLSTFAEDGPERCSGLPVCRYTARQVTDMFGAFELVHSERVEHHTPWQARQPFNAVVLQRRVGTGTERRAN